MINCAAAAVAKSFQSCPTLCDPIDGSPPGSPIPGILQARTLEWVAISFSNAWKWKVKVKSLSRVWLLANSWTAAYQAPPSMGFSRQEYWSGVPLTVLAFYEKDLRENTFFWLTHVINKRREKWVTNWKILKVIKSEHTVGQPHSWPRNLPGRTHKASAVVAVGVQAVPVCNPRTADLVPVGS